MALAWAALTLLGLLALPSPVSAQDTTPPTLNRTSTVGTNGQDVTFRFSEDLDQSNLPAASAFTVTVDGSAATVTGVEVTAFSPPFLFVTVSPVIRQGQAVVATYTDPTTGDDANGEGVPQERWPRSTGPRSRNICGLRARFSPAIRR